MLQPGDTAIYMNKGKLWKQLVLSLLFVVIGIWMLIYRPEVNNGLFNRPVVKYGVAVLCILFFGAAAIFFIRKLGDKRPALTLTSEGIEDHSNAVSLGLIPWRDILAVEPLKVLRQEFLIIRVANPQEYLVKSTNYFKRASLKYNFRHYGSPLAITANTLKISLSELMAMIELRLKEFRARNER